MTLNPLEAYRNELRKHVNSVRDVVRSRREARGYVTRKPFITELRSTLAEVMAKVAPEFPFDAFTIDLIERASFRADLVFKSSKLIATDKVSYLKKLCPALTETLRTLEVNGGLMFSKVEMVGMYVNATLHSSQIFQALEQIETLGDAFGESDAGRGKDVVLDYSSPNVAKHLHAGHIRSTIIGHILGNLHEACGYTAHRINYINDWGGMGFLIEGISRRTDSDQYENKNNFLADVYGNFRKAQKLSEKEEEFANMTAEDRVALEAFLGTWTDFASYSARFADYVRASAERFSALEAGKEEEFALWRQIVEWSLADFEEFYSILGVHQDYVAGESLYALSGKDLVLELVKNPASHVVFFDQSEADKALAENQSLIASGAISEEVGERRKQEILADIGCYVVLLDNQERFVVMKKDGSTIYATRDLAAIAHRVGVFHPTKMLYEVGQEQQEHFDKLFRSARAIGYAQDLEMTHIYHGFYTDELTKKKLSSRDGASNILKLLRSSIAYFYAKYDDTSEFSESEKQHIAEVLGVWSIVFNDIKKDRKSNIALSADFDKMMRGFEESGGAYLIYASCRAKSIIRKYGKPVMAISDIALKDFSDVEIDLIKKLLDFPNVVAKACETNDIVKISEYITSLASAFNSYYHSTKTLGSDEVDQRIVIVGAVSTVIDNALRMLHVGTLERI